MENAPCINRSPFESVLINVCMFYKYRFYNTSGDGEETPGPSDDGGLGEDIVGYLSH